MQTIDLWRGFYRANTLGWVKGLNADDMPRNKADMNGSLDFIIPGKLALTREFETNFSKSSRPPIPSTAINRANALSTRSTQIKTLISLVGQQGYENDDFRSGITWVSCEFDTPTPAPGDVAVFLYTLRTAGPGAVAVQCDGSLGRAGTLCALHLMHTHGFDAAEAVGWLHLTCPAMRLRPDQAAFLRAVHADLASAANTAAEPADEKSLAAGRRDAGFRRSVYRAWAGGQRPSGRLRPQSRHWPAAAPADKTSCAESACAWFGRSQSPPCFVETLGTALGLRVLEYAAMTGRRWLAGGAGLAGSARGDCAGVGEEDGVGRAAAPSLPAPLRMS